MRSPSAWLMLPVLAGAALPVRAQDVPANGSTIVTDMEQSSGGDFAQVIYVMNHSSHAVIVTSIRLMECENVQGNCGTRRTGQRVPPGGRVMVQRVDTVVVLPKLLDIKAGETIDLSQVLSIKAMNAAGQQLPRIFFYTEIALGEEFISLDGSRLTGKAPGTAALLISASTVQGPVPPRKGAVRILVQVTP